MPIATQPADVEFMQFAIEYDPYRGDPRRIFKAMVELIDAVEMTGKVFLKGIDPTLTFQLGVQETSSGSLLTKVIGMVKNKEGERLPMERESVLNQGIADASKTVLRAQRDVDQHGHVDEKAVAESICTIQSESAQAFSRTCGRTVPLLVAKPVSEKQVRGLMSSLATGAFILGPDDRAGFEVAGETIDLNRELKPYGVEAVAIDTGPDALSVTDAGAGPRLIRVLTPRYGTPKGWEVIHQDQTYKAEILHTEWYDRIHEQFEEVGPKDQLLVDAEFEMRRTPTGRSSAVCRINKVISVKKFSPESPEFLNGMEDVS